MNHFLYVAMFHVGQRSCFLLNGIGKLQLNDRSFALYLKTTSTTNFPINRTILLCLRPVLQTRKKKYLSKSSSFRGHDAVAFMRTKRQAHPVGSHKNLGNSRRKTNGIIQHCRRTNLSHECILPAYTQHFPPQVQFLQLK